MKKAIEIINNLFSPDRTTLDKKIKLEKSLPKSMVKKPKIHTTYPGEKRDFYGLSSDQEWNEKILNKE